MHVSAVCVLAVGPGPPGDQRQPGQDHDRGRYGRRGNPFVEHDRGGGHADHRDEQAERCHPGDREHRPHTQTSDRVHHDARTVHDAGKRQQWHRRNQARVGEQRERPALAAGPHYHVRHRPRGRRRERQPEAHRSPGVRVHPTTPALRRTIFAVTRAAGVGPQRTAIAALLSELRSASPIRVRASSRGA